MKKQNKTSGITLIALIITIIVLLILAGVTINAISGSDSAPAKANEAGQKNDIGAAKDDVSLAVVNAQTEGFETAYVENGVSAGNAQSTVGKTVIQALETKYASNNTIGKATISVDVTRDANNEITGGTVTIFTTDFEVVGTIDVNGGNLSWGEIENNIPGIKGVPETLSMDTGTTKTINATLKGITGTITWTSTDEDVATVSNGVIRAADTLIVNDQPVNTATVTITATLGSYSESCTVTVHKVVAPQVGEVVNYAPNQTYTWDYSLAESGSGANTGTTSLSSSITQWKILNYNPTTKMVEMVPSTVPTSSSTNKLTLRGAQGYNNAVYLLNNACNSLYGNGTTITARSINEEDFINASAIDSNVSTNGGNKWLNYRATTYKNTNVKKADNTDVYYGEQKNGAYTSSSYRNYPVMYAYDNNSVINGETPSTASLGLSVQNDPIASTKDGATNGYLNASTSIQPYQTYYNTSNNSTTVGLLDSTKAGLLVPSNAQYWVASRCVCLGSISCGFGVRDVTSGYLHADNVFYSSTNTNDPAYALFPVVSLSSELLEPSTTSGVAWEVDAN